MRARRVVITGIGLVAPLGDSFDELMSNLYQGRSGIRRDDSGLLKKYQLSTNLSAPVTSFEERVIPRKIRRSMSRVALMAVKASGDAIRDADLAEELLQSERTGISYASTMGGVSSIEEYFGDIAVSGKIDGVMTSTFMKIMSHTCAANIALAYMIPGRVIASCCACAASTHSLGYGYEAIKHGYLDRAISGGAEELHVAVVGVFDVLRSTSVKYNASPSETPRPFDRERDGIVVGEGAGALILEEYEMAKKRGAKIYGEIVGFYTNNDANHMTNPSSQGLEAAMLGALASAGVKPSDIGYVNAHGTGTVIGDLSESHAIGRIFGSKVAVSSTKGHLGHLMGACGVLESIACLGMLREERLLPTLNLDEVDPACGKLDYVKGEPRRDAVKYILKNSFAFGGINASIIFSRSE